MNGNQLKEVEDLLKQEKAEEAQTLFATIVPAETVAYLVVQGKLEQKFQNWGAAINAYSKVVDLEPENEEAQNNLHLIQNILNFWNPEMFNP